MSRNQHNLIHLELVSEALGELLHEVTFVGGCTTVLLVDEAALSGVKIRVVSPGYFLATKFEAFQGRGGGDYAASHDLEDIVFLLENRTDLMKELIDYPVELKAYIADQANDLLNDEFLNILPGLVMGPEGKDAVENYLKLISNWSR